MNVPQSDGMKLVADELQNTLSLEYLKPQKMIREKSKIELLYASLVIKRTQ